MPDITNDVMANVPASVVVAFVKSIDGSVTTRDRIAIGVYLEDLALTQYAGKIGHTGQVIIKSAAIGDITTSYEAIGSNLDQPPPDITNWLDLGVVTVGALDWDARTTYVAGQIVQIPGNYTELQDLAIQLATDYYLWKLASLELRLASYVTLDGDGGHDIEFWHDDPQTVIHRSGWEPDTGEFFHSGSNGSFSPEVTIITNPATGTATGPQFTVEPTNGLTAVAGESTLTLGFGGEPYSIIWTEADESPQFTPDVLSFDGYTLSAQASFYFNIQDDSYYLLEDASLGNTYVYAYQDFISMMNENVQIEISNGSNGGRGLKVDAYSNLFAGTPRETNSLYGFMYYSYSDGQPDPDPAPLISAPGYGALYIDISTTTGKAWWIYTLDGWVRLANDPLTIINVTNINTYTFIENTIVFNQFNQTINIKFGDNIFIFYADCCEGRKWYCMSKDAAQSCYNLTPTEYAQMLIAGYTKISGPHDTKLECVTSCDAVPKYWWCLELAAVQDCYELSEAELLVAIDTNGYVPISGPYLSEADCLILCGSSTFTCADIGSPVSYAFAADDACLDGFAGTMTQGFGYTWSNLNVPSPCATDTGLLFDCAGDVPTASYNNCALTLISATATSATFTGTGCAPITGSFTVVFTW